MARLSKLDRRTMAVFAKASPFSGVQNEPRPDRYIPRAYRPDDTGWGVWDRKEQRYIEAAELLTISVAQLRDATFVH